MGDNDNRNLLLPALFIMAIGAAVLAQASGFSVLLILLGLLFLVRHFDNNRSDDAIRYTSRRLADYEDNYYDYEEYEEDEDYLPQRQAHSEPVYRHALQAVRRAGLDPDAVQVLPVDVGVMAFRGDEEPVVYRTWPIPDDVDYIQPYVQLRLPTNAIGRVRFELYDSTGEVIFIHEDNHNLVRGRNLITPASRMPIHDERNMNGNWTIRVSADGVLLAQHTFNWVEAADDSIRKHIGEDGELTTELRAVMANNRLEKMTLDELLSFQDTDSAQQQQSG